MARSVEGIVEAHQLSRSRTRAGRPSWEGSLTFMKELGKVGERHHEGDITLTAAVVLDAFHAAAKEVRAKVPQAQGKFFESNDDDLEAFVLTLEEWNISFIEGCADIFDEFDEVLDRMYDWCDRNRWWVEPA